MITLLLISSLVNNPVYRSAQELATTLEIAPGWTCEVTKRFTYCCQDGLQPVFDRNPQVRTWICEGDPAMNPRYVERAKVMKRFGGDAR